MTSPQLTESPTSQPNQFTLNGENLSIKFALGGSDGQPHLRYQDSHQVMEFKGDQIALETTSVGQFATVVTLDTADIGHTSFTLIIPAVDVSAGPQTVATLGLTTLHRTRPSAYARGQLRTYHITELRGAATHIAF